MEAAVGRRFDAGLAEALDARILELDGERLRFTHPLLGSAVAARQTPARRRSLHARLAEIVPSAEERARHLALATAEPDQRVASILEEAARTAHARGAPAAAAELAEQALRLTPASSPDDARRRLFVAADMHNRAGDADRATALLEQARAAAAPGNERATVLAHLAGVQPSPQDAVALYREALSEAEGDDALQATIHLGLAALMRLERRDSSAASSTASSPSAPPRASATLRSAAAHSRRTASCTSTPDAASRPRRWKRRSRSNDRWPSGRSTTARRGLYGWQLCWSADVDRARELFQELLRVARARNDPAGEADALHSLSLLESRAGNWEEADRHATDSIDLKTQLGRLTPPDEFPAAIIAAHRGRIDEARARSQGAIARAEAEGIGIAQSGHGWVLGFVELSRGDAMRRSRT